MFIQVLKPACCVRVETNGTMTVVTLRGSADLTAVDALQTELSKVLAAPPRWLVFDLGELEFISSLAVGVLIGAARETKRLGGAARIINARPLVLELIQITKLNELFEIGQ